MTDVAPALYEKLHKDFNARLDANARLAKMKVKGNLTYKDAQGYSEIIGDTLQKSFRLIKGSDLPGGVMYYNIAERTVKPMMTEAYDKVAEYTEQVQKSMNKRAGLKMKAAVPDVPEDRINGIVDRLSSGELFDDIAWLLQEPVTNYCMSIPVDFIQANAELQTKAGVKAYIVRTAEAKCCEWCENLEGIYEYPVQDTGVYQRHENCRCSVEYFNEAEQTKQDVWTKAQAPADTRQEMLGRYNTIVKNMRKRANSRG